MGSIVENSARIGRFTSSKISLLMDKPRSKGSLFSVGATTYIRNKANERMLGRSLDLGKSGSSAQWGLFLEQYVFSQFTGIEYKIMANESVIYNDYLSGSADLIVEGVKISDIKCFEPEKFCNYSNMINAQDAERFKLEFKSEYWQLVSNAIINNVPNAEAIAYMPTLEELKEIQELAGDYDGADQWKYRFIVESPLHQLPYIPDGSKYNNLNKFEFVVPQEDKEFLLERVKLAGSELQKLTEL
jgi:hypothetical protein